MSGSALNSTVDCNVDHVTHQMKTEAVSRFRPTVTSCNEYLTCGLCHGYLIDAVSNVNCRHSFCRSCVRMHLDRNQFCPVCKSRDNVDTLLLDLRHDLLLQTVVYKVVPSLFHSELQRRIDFVDGLTDGAGSIGDSWRRKQARCIRLPRNIYSGAERISLCLIRCDSVPYKVTDREDNIQTEQNSEIGAILSEARRKTDHQHRYLLCPVALTIGHLKKYIRFKYDMDETLEVDVFHSDDVLLDEYNLIDVVYIYSKVKLRELTLLYVIFDSTSGKGHRSQRSKCKDSHLQRNRKRKHVLENQRHPKRRETNGEDSVSEKFRHRKSHSVAKLRHFESDGDDDLEPNDFRGNYTPEDEDPSIRREPAYPGRLRAEYDVDSSDIVPRGARGCSSAHIPEPLRNNNDPATTTGDDCTTTGFRFSNGGCSGGGAVEDTAKENGTLDATEDDRCVEKTFSSHVQMVSGNNDFNDVVSCSDFLYTHGHAIQIGNYYQESDNAGHWLTEAQNGVIEDQDTARPHPPAAPSPSPPEAKDSDSEIDTEIRRIAANVAINHENSMMADYGINDDSDSAMPSPYLEPSPTAMGAGGEEDETVPRSIIDSIEISQLFSPAGGTAAAAAVGGVGMPVVGNFLVEAGVGQAFEYLVQGERTPWTTTYVDPAQQPLLSSSSSAADSGFRILPEVCPSGQSPMFPGRASLSYPDPVEEQQTDSIVDCFSTDPVCHSSDRLDISQLADVMRSSAVTMMTSASESLCSAAGGEVGMLGIEIVDEISGSNAPLSNRRNDFQTYTENFQEISTKDAVANLTPDESLGSAEGQCPFPEEIHPRNSTEEETRSNAAAEVIGSDAELRGTETATPSPNRCNDEGNEEAATVQPSAPLTVDQFTSLAQDLKSTASKDPEESPVVANMRDSVHCSITRKSVVDREKVDEVVSSDAAVKESEDFSARIAKSPAKLSTLMKTKDIQIPTSAQDFANCGPQSKTPTSNNYSPLVLNGCVSRDTEYENADRPNDVPLAKASKQRNSIESQMNGKEDSDNTLQKLSVTSEIPTSENNNSSGSGTIMAEQSGIQQGSKISVGTQTNIDLLGRYFKRRVNPVGSYLCGKSPRTGTTVARDRPCKSTKSSSSSSAVSSKTTTSGLSSTPSMSPAAGAVTSQAAILLSGHGTPILFPAVSPVTINGKGTILITVPANFSFPNQNVLRPNMTLIQTRLNYPRSTSAAAAAAAGFSVVQQRNPTSQAMVVGRAVGPPLQLLVPSMNSSVPVSDAFSREIRAPVSTIAAAAAASGIARSGYVCRVGGTASNQYNIPRVSDSVIISTTCHVSVTTTPLPADFKQDRAGVASIVAPCPSLSQLRLSASTFPTFVLSSEPLFSLQGKNFCVNNNNNNNNTRAESESVLQRGGGGGHMTGVGARPRADNNHSSQTASQPSAPTSSAICSSASSTSSTGLPRLSGARHISISNIPHIGCKFSVPRKDPDQRNSLSSSSSAASKSSMSSSISPDVQPTSLLFASASSSSTLPCSSSPVTTVAASAALPSSASGCPSAVPATASDICVSFQFDSKSGNYSLSHNQRIEGAPVSLIRAILERNLTSPYDSDNRSAMTRAPPPSRNSNQSTVDGTVTENGQAVSDKNHESTRSVFAFGAATDDRVSESSSLKISNANRFTDRNLQPPKRKPHEATEMETSTTTERKSSRVVSLPDGGNGMSIQDHPDSAGGKCLPHPSGGVVTRSQRSGASNGRPGDGVRCPAGSPSVRSSPAPPMAAVSRRRPAAEANLRTPPGGGGGGGGGASMKKKRRNATEIIDGLRTRDHDNDDDYVITPTEVGGRANRCPPPPPPPPPPDVSESGDSGRRCSSSRNSGILVRPPSALPGIFSKTEEEETGSQGAISPSSTAVGCCGQLPETRRQPTTPTLPSNSGSCFTGGNHSGGGGGGGGGGGHGSHRVDASPPSSSSDCPSKPGWTSMSVGTRSGMVALPKKLYTYFGSSAMSHEHHMAAAAAAVAARDKGGDAAPPPQQALPPPAVRDDQAPPEEKDPGGEGKASPPPPLPPPPQKQTPVCCYLRPSDEDIESQAAAPPINQLRRMCSYIQNGRRGDRGASPPVPLDTELLPPRLSPFT